MTSSRIINPSILIFAVFGSHTSAQDYSCEGCVGNGRKCVGDQAIQALNDEDCALCLKSSSKWTWPCSVPGLCWCWDSNKPKVKQALSSGFEEGTKKPCDLFSEKAFNALAPNAVFPYTYEGLCETIDYFNERYDEKLFMMGSVTQQRNELAAFLGHTTHESAQYTAAREALPCARTTERGSGTYCKPCAEANFDWTNRYCEVSEVANGQYYEDYCDKTVTPPHGCVCGPTTEVDKEDLKGLMNPNFAYFGRGAIQLSWNANYLKASQVLAESSDTLCSQPDLVATDPKYAWGTALWFWLFQKPEGGADTTCHIEALNGRFGGTLNIINGGLECPPVDGSYHEDAIVTRLRYYCIAAEIMEVKALLSFEGCVGLAESFEECVMSGFCPECVDWFKAPSMEPTKAPTPRRPTNQPTRWRSWADSDWMSEIKRRDSPADRTSSVLGGVTFLATLYLIGQ